MLVLSRGKGEVLIINHPLGPIRIMVTEIRPGRCKIGIEAPKEVDISREEKIDKEAA